MRDTYWTFARYGLIVRREFRGSWMLVEEGLREANPKGEQQVSELKFSYDYEE